MHVLAVFVSIDCGATGSYTDENSIIWTGDDLYNIQNGESQVVQSPNSVPHVMSSLKVFSSRKKNCYSVAADKGGQVLVRASFFYGNYDKKSTPPSFDLHFDGNFWTTVETSSDRIVSYEAIYVVKGDAVSVCVAQTKPNQLPFMSALEVRSLASTMYSHVDANYALFLRRRVAFGSNQTVRYSADPYDRIWAPSVPAAGLVSVASDLPRIDINVEDNPPQAVLQNAITTTSASTSIRLGTNLPPIKVPIYMTFYFAEVAQLDSTRNRSFTFNIDDQPISKPIIPSYGSVAEKYLTNVTASSNTTFSLVATADSTLPPLINALEVYTVSDALADGTNPKDLEGLASLQNVFDVLQGWSGDPCLPSPFTWDWVKCSTAATPRVTALYLSSFGLTGSLPQFSSMDALQIIDLHNNSLSGEIPDFFGTLPNLKQLNLANNDFSGTIPASISNNNNLKLVITGNPNLCISGQSCQTTGTSTGTSSGITETTAGGRRKKKGNKLPVILGPTIPAFVLFWAIVGVVAILKQKRKTATVAAAGAFWSGGGLGQNGGGNRPSGTPNMQMIGKIGQAVMNEQKVEIKEEISNNEDDQQFDGYPQNPTNAA
ncbi:probable LRR receptor-like serine/threonine-protein kinase At1g05700 [Malania oleifera]|uniref:probable LRR receptor-like serine/threonine-protein kinase At1g05700 n=1 Tax=Malania oleifera TaxID=397392 RepID=UPI0025AE3329|nr:probable LRR receptor-like serine/threonine-protein kinase At1g05700 [Malania oleifera]